MIQDRYSSYGPNSYDIPLTLREEMNRQITSLTNENTYYFLRGHFDESRSDELKSIDFVYLLQQDPFGQTMLHWASVKGDFEVTKFIIEKTKDQLFKSLTRVDRYTALHLAVHGENKEVIALLVDKSKEFGLDDFVDKTDINGQTALHWAAGKGDFDACEKLYSTMSPPAIVIQMEDRKQTALHFAVQGGYRSIVELLLSNDVIAKALLVKVDKFGQSALHWAAGQPSAKVKEMVDVLVKRAKELGPEFFKDFIFIRKNEGYTALHTGVHSASNASIKLLVEETKDIIPEFISATDIYGQTALHWAAINLKLPDICECGFHHFQPYLDLEKAW